MLKINWKKKLIAMLLIFTLTFGNFALVGKAYAATIFDNLFLDNEGDTGSSNVEFDAKFLIYENVDQEDENSNETTEPDSKTDNAGVPSEMSEEPNTELDNSDNSTETEKSEESGNTEEPEVPGNQENPEEPEVPSKPEEPKEPETPEVPEEPETVTKEKTKVTANVNDTNIRLKLALKVLNTGYLKEAKITLGNGKKLNFAINTDNFENVAVQNFENNQIELVQLASGSNIEIELPIYYENSKYVQLENISKTNKIKFEGTYIDGEDEISVSKEVDLKLSWQDKREVKVSSEITKYIGYSVDGVSGVILQMLVKSDNSTTQKALPVNTSNLEVEVPEINGVKPATMTVAATSVLGTTEKDEVIFDENSLIFNEETNILKLILTNKSKFVSPQSEDEVLIDETLDDIEAYYVGSGVDEYLITYIYKDVSIENVQINSNIVSTYNMYGDTTLTASESNTYDLTQEIGDIVTVNVQSDNNPISKVYTYLNYNNEENKYEIVIDNKIIFNVSYKDIVDGLYYEDGANYYVSDSGDRYAQNDIYYKSLKISKNNFDEMLGEEGYIKLYDLDGNLLSEINNEIKLEEGAEYYDISFEEPIKGIKIETSKPIIEGNLTINAQKAYKDVSYDKTSYKEFNKIVMESSGKAKYTYLQELVDCGNNVSEVELQDTISDAELVIGRDTLSTLAENQNVEMKIILNNDKLSSDIYGQSEFEIKMPKYIERFEVNDYSIIYGEGLEISNISSYEENGNVYLRISLSGIQKAISSGIVSGGTNIVLDADIKVDLYAPATQADFELRYINNEATRYGETLDGVGFDKAIVKYSAPSGLVSVNSISNYNDNGDTVVSVKQGKKMGDIAVYSSTRKATMDIIVMNNEENSVSNFSILGRTIFEGNKDILTGESLGTTLILAPMINPISADQNNGAEFKVYYSTNPDATNDLSDTENGWVETIENLAEVKSYLIVPVDENYELDIANRLHFSYDFEIPASLAHNEYLYGTFGTYYTNNTAVATLNELSLPDVVGLTTGVGPELEINMDLSRNSVSEFEEFEIITTVKNIGEVTARNLKIEVPLPVNTTYKDSNSETQGIYAVQENDKLIYSLDALGVGQDIKIRTLFTVNQMGSSSENNALELFSTVTADDLDITLKTEPKTLTINRAEFKIEVRDVADQGRDISSSGDSIMLRIFATNLKSETVENAQVSMYLDEAFKFNEKNITIKDSNREVVVKYNEQTRMITWDVGKVIPNETVNLPVYFDVVGINEAELKRDIDVKASVKADGTSEYTSLPYTIEVGTVSLSIEQTTTTLNSFVTEGKTIEYIFYVRNEGYAKAEIKFTDEASKGLFIRSITYASNGSKATKTVSGNTASVSMYIQPRETIEISVKVAANALHGMKERTVTNKGFLECKGSKLESNTITHIVEANPNKSSSTIGETSSNSGAVNPSQSNGVRRTYKIAGTVWKDSNRNGAREGSEDLMKGIKATLVNSDTGVIKQTLTTNKKGEYTFNGVANGNYIIIFDYDTVKYTATAYQKENVASNLNSDAISTSIDQDGKSRNGAVTHVIKVSDGSISNIDLGLVDAMKFDLSLNLGITKVTVQNKKGTKTTKYNSETLTKTEVSQKYLAGSEIYIEYTIRIKNEGELAGYAKKIVDYIPEGMNFNSRLNSSWYTGNDGNLYTTSLSNVEIAPGETKTCTLVLSKTMTSENTGRVSNTAEIAEDYNIYGISDIDSSPGNNNQNEDDFDRADSILAVGTGAIYIYVSVIITTITLIGTAIFIVILKRKNKVIKGGV